MRLDRSMTNNISPSCSNSGPMPEQSDGSISRNTSRRQVCLFGLSADPPTGDGGHVGMARILSAGKMFDEVRILPVYRHQFNSKRDRLRPFSDRFHMCQLAFDGLPKVVVSDCEKRCFGHLSKGLSQDQLERLRVGTADLLDMLIEEEPSVDFTFAMGADTFMDLTNWKWRRSKDILQLLGGRIVTFVRKLPSPTIDSAEDTNGDSMHGALGKRVQLINAQEGAQVRLLHDEKSLLRDVSSTMIRAMSKPDELEGLVAPAVQEYIVKNKLYGFDDANCP